MAGAKHVTAVALSSPTSLDVTSAALPGWAIAVAILFFPVGLLALLAKSPRLLHMRAELADDGTLLHIDGATTPGVQSRLVEIWNQLAADQRVTVR